MTICDVALHLGVGWDLIKEIQKRDLSRRFAKPKLKHLRWIAIDEIAVAKLNFGPFSGGRIALFSRLSVLSGPSF